MKSRFPNPIKISFLIFGWISFALGVLGIFLPLLPTTPFLLLATYCFSRGSPKINEWIHGLPQIGQILSEWENHRVIRLKAKISASLLLIPAVVYVCWRPQIPLIGQISFATLATGVLLFLWTRPSRKSQ
jgi:uncharacterized membrane protein YbaN (DUF454 family)